MSADPTRDLRFEQVFGTIYCERQEKVAYLTGIKTRKNKNVGNCLAKVVKMPKIRSRMHCTLKK